MLKIVTLRARSHGVPSPKFQVTWGQFMQSQPLRAWEVGILPLHMRSQVSSLKYDMDAYMAILFGGEAWDLCWGLGKL